MWLWCSIRIYNLYLISIEVNHSLFFFFRKAKETYVKLRKERDYHRMHHKRVVQEKNKLINDIKRWQSINDIYINCWFTCTVVKLISSLLVHFFITIHIYRLKRHYAQYEPTLQQLKKKYEVAMKEKMLSKLEKDRAVGQVAGLQSTLKSMESFKGTPPSGFQTGMYNIGTISNVPPREVTLWEIRNFQAL